MTGCGLGEGQVAPVYVELSLAPLFVVKHYGFNTFWHKMTPGALGASGCLLGVSWSLLGVSCVSPGCLLGASLVSPGSFLGVSWELPGCLKMTPDASR